MFPTFTLRISMSQTEQVPVVFLLLHYRILVMTFLVFFGSIDFALNRTLETTSFKK